MRKCRENILREMFNRDWIIVEANATVVLYTFHYFSILYEMETRLTHTLTHATYIHVRTHTYIGKDIFFKYVNDILYKCEEEERKKGRNQNFSQFNA